MPILILPPQLQMRHQKQLLPLLMPLMLLLPLLLLPLLIMRPMLALVVQDMVLGRTHH
jgi:hypothetical protein